LRLNSVHTSAAAGEKDQLSVNVYVDGELVKSIVGAKPKAALLKELQPFADLS
ncbi:MAG: hypothetical protein QOH03_4240, partial [Kribbellaceae bacterium]|nr:hypothetical protein [Kribbellaceae bacterium]